MFQYLFSFESLTAAQTARGVLDALYIPCRIVRAPREVAKRGCGYVLRVAGRDGARTADILRGQQILFSNSFRVLQDGTTEEAKL